MTLEGAADRSAKQQTGTALLLVMWLLALLSILLGSFALLARSERYQARFLFDATQARYAAEAGIHRAAWALAIPDVNLRWIADGRSYTFEFAQAQVEVKVTDETGKIDLNAADLEVMRWLFIASGVEDQAAAALAAAIVDWRDPDDLLTPNGAEDQDYRAADLHYECKDAPFDTLSELQQVLGMDYRIYARIAPSLTLESRQVRPNPAFAPELVLQALGGVDAVQAEQLVAARRGWSPATGLPPPLGPDGTQLMATAGSGTYSVVSRARLANGAWAELDSSLRLVGSGTSGLAFRVLRWQDGATP